MLGKVLLILTDKHATELLIYSNSGIIRKYIIVAAYASMCKNVTEYAVTVVLLRNPPPSVCNFIFGHILNTAVLVRTLSVFVRI